MLSADNVNRYAHLGGLVAGFVLVWLPRQFGGLKVDESFLLKEDPDAPFKRELAALDALIGSFALDQAASRGLDLLSRYPARLALLERLYPVAKSRQDSALLSAVLKQLFALPAASGQLGLLQKLADDSQAADAKLLQHPAIQLHLLQGLLRAQEPARALGAWRKLSQGTQRPAQLPALTLALAKQLARQQPRALGELSAFLQQAYPATEQAAQIGLLRAQLS